MQCRETRELLSPYLDGVFNPTEEEAVSTHLKACSDCRCEWHYYQGASEAIKQLPEIEPSPDFSGMVIKKITATAPATPKKPQRHSIFNALTGSWSRAAAFVATMIITIGVSTLVYSTPGQWGFSSLFQPQASYVQGQGQGSGTQGAGKTENGSSLASRITKVLSAQPESARPAPVEVAGSGAHQPEKNSLKADVIANSESVEQGSAGGIVSDGDMSLEQKTIEDLPLAKLDHRDNLIPLSVAAEKPPETTKITGINNTATTGGIYITNKELPKIVRSATLSISPEDPGEARIQIRELARNHDCRLLSEVNSGKIVMKIPSERYAEVLESLSALGPVKFKQNVTRDVTGRYYYYEARLLALQDEEARLSSSATGSTGHQKVQERLELVRNKIKANSQMLDRLEKDLEFATLTINLE